MYDLIERQKAIDLVTKLFVETDNRNWEAVKACFTPKVRFDMTSLTGGEPSDKTPEEITAAWDSGFQGVDSVHHQAGNFLVTMDEKTASVFCYAVATHYKKVPSGNNTRTFVGSYDFGLSKDDSNWKVSSFEFNLKYMDGNIELI